ncbi:MAG: malonyl CoA-acyl carrier protein transacylase, partial [Thermomicrobiales bacterium]|nr:malonyl CoA-acyl carrier protein transacylase [Thermomicrobiales bacterium]
LLDQICASVRWVDVVAFLTGSGANAFYEIGPGKVLSGLIGRCARGMETTTAEVLLSG